MLETPFFSIRTVDCDQYTDPYYILDGPDSIICCVLNEDDEFLLVRQYRPNLGLISLEMPAGGIEQFESPFEACERELHEELRVKCEIIAIPGTYSLMMNRTSIKDHLFFAMNPVALGPANGVYEDVQSTRIRREDFFSDFEELGYKQLGGLGLIAALNMYSSINLIEDSYEEISRKFQTLQANK